MVFHTTQNNYKKNPSNCWSLVILILYFVLPLNLGFVVPYLVTVIFTEFITIVLMSLTYKLS